MEKLYIVSKNETWSWLRFRSWAPYCKIQAWTEKVGKTSRPFRYVLIQISYDYTVEVMNSFKGLNLTDRVPEVLWLEVHNTVQEAVTKTTPKKKRRKKAKWLSEEALQIAEKGEKWKAKAKGKDKHNWMQSSRE